MTARSPESVNFGDFRFIPGDGLWRDGRAVPLPPRALGVLSALLATPGVVVSKKALMDAVWPDTFVTESSLLEAIGLLRNALGDDRRQPTYIQTVHRRGYRFIGVRDQGSGIGVQAAESREPKAGSGSQGEKPLQPILIASATYAITTIFVAVVFALFGHDRPEPVATLEAPAAPRFAISHSGELVYLSSSGAAIIPSWTPSGLDIAFAFSKAGPFNLLMPLPGDSTSLLAGPGREFPTSWSADNHQLAFTDYQPLTGADIWVFDLRTQTRRAFARTWFDETWARFSPDGHWIAYMSNESGRWDVYVQSADGRGPRVKVSTMGGVWPSWSTDSATIFFTAGTATMGARIKTAPVLLAANPVIVHEGGARATGRADLRIVLEWFSEMAQPAAISKPQS